MTLPNLNLPQDAYNLARKAALATIVGLSAEELLNVVLEGHDTELDIVPEWLMSRLITLVGDVEQTVGAPLFASIVSAAAGVNLSTQPGHQEAEAVKMVERMLGFAVALPFATQKLEAGLKALLGDHAPEGLIESITKMPEELGVNFFIGTVLERIFETAVSRPLEEAISEQKRPARLEWPQIRALARQHAISDDELVDRLRKAGFRDEDIPLIKQIDRQRLTVSDLQLAYLNGTRDEEWIRSYCDQIGLTGEDQDIIVDNYVRKAETAGGDQLRIVAQQAYLADHITEQTYEGYLRQAGVPAVSIGLEVQATNLSKELGRRQLSISEIKRLHADNVIDDAQAQKRLTDIGYSQEDASATVQDWHVIKTASRPGLTENRILSYLAGGVIGKVDAYNRLIVLGIRPEDATFLVNHPSVQAAVRPHGLSEQTIVSALKDQIITQDEAHAKLLAAGVSAEEADLRIRIALVAANRGPRVKAAAKRLGEGQVVEAFKYGLASDTWAHRELVALGYSDVDASILLAIETTKLSMAIPDGWTMLT